MYACEAPARPNIVMLIADDMGWADVGYHDSEIRTPAIDRIAADGMREICVNQLRIASRLRRLVRPWPPFFSGPDRYHGLQIISKT